MVIPLFLCVTWASICVFSAMPRRLTFIEHVFLFYIMSIIVGSTFTVITLNLKYIHVSDETAKTMAFYILRTIEVPLVLLIFANLCRYRMSTLAKWAASLCTVIFLMFLRWMSLQFNVIEFKHWSWFADFTMTSGFVAITYIASWWFQYLGRNEVKKA